MALSQIGRKPVNDKHLERDGYSLAAGIALGLMNLCKGAQDPSIRDLNLEERLIRLIEGGKTEEGEGRVHSSGQGDHRWTGDSRWTGDHRGIDDHRCSSIREGNRVNTHVTAPAALMALAMLALMSNNQQLYHKITIPDTFQQLENTNPNLILMKIVCKNLIMWDSIGCTSDFIYK